MLNTGKEVSFSPVFCLQSAGLKRKLNLRKLYSFCWQFVIKYCIVCNKKSHYTHAQFTLLFSNLPVQERYLFLSACLDFFFKHFIQSSIPFGKIQGTEMYQLGFNVCDPISFVNFKQFLSYWNFFFSPKAIVQTKET